MEQKTVVTALQTGFNFLGHTLRKYEDKLLITSAKGKGQILREKIRGRRQAPLGLTQEALRRQLNPLLRGWANYCRNGAAKATFGKLDHHVRRKQGRWITRRHPKKSQAWKKYKCFSAAGEKGFFSVRVHGKKGQNHLS
jgi:RNA-directed DNA polymerase